MAILTSYPPHSTADLTIGQLIIWLETSMVRGSTNTTLGDLLILPPAMLLDAAFDIYKTVEPTFTPNLANVAFDATVLDAVSGGIESGLLNAFALVCFPSQLWLDLRSRYSQRPARRFALERAQELRRAVGWPALDEGSEIRADGRTTAALKEKASTSTLFFFKLERVTANQRTDTKQSGSITRHLSPLEQLTAEALRAYLHLAFGVSLFRDFGRSRIGLFAA